MRAGHPPATSGSPSCASAPPRPGGRLTCILSRSRAPPSGFRYPYESRPRAHAHAGQRQLPTFAVLLRTEDELFPTLASFYALGARRNGLLAHRSVRHAAESDRARLIAAGLDAAGLEREGRLRIVDFDPDEPPDASAERWNPVLDEALEDGYGALWYSRFADRPRQRGVPARCPVRAGMGDELHRSSRGHSLPVHRRRAQRHRRP